MTPAYDQLVQVLKKLPGLGFRSAEKLALHLLVEKPEKVKEVVEILLQASQEVQRCTICGNLTESELCAICASPHRQSNLICVVETIPDLISMERSGAYEGVYHILFGKLSPLKGVGPEQLNLAGLWERLQQRACEEIVLALSNDLEGEATCHWLQDQVGQRFPEVQVSRIGFGLPSGSSLLFADGPTLKNALASRRSIHGG